MTQNPLSSKLVAAFMPGIFYPAFFYSEKRNDTNEPI
jgi:hypothetical protein